MIAGGLIYAALPPNLSAGDPDRECRLMLKRSLVGVAFQAQKYYHMRAYRNGGQGSFAVVWLGSLVHSPFTPYGSVVLSAPSATSVTLTGTGLTAGWWDQYPMELDVITYPDSLTVTVTN